MYKNFFSKFWQSLVWKILKDQTGAIYYGKKGALFVGDSTKARDLSITGPKEVHISNYVSAAHNDITANMLNPSSGTATILAVNTDFLYIGNLFPFSKVDFDLTSPASADGGVMIAEYWNGSQWTALTILANRLSDGTAVGGNTLQQDGKIKFDIPADWAKNDVPAAGTALYYIRLHTTASTGTDAVAQLIEVSSGQYFKIAFVQMDLNASEGPPRPEEIIVLDRAQLNAAAGYIQGSDDVIMGPMPLSFSARLDDTVNKTALIEALSCGTPGNATWPNVGISTKGNSQRPSGLTGTLVYTPLFNDPLKKCVWVQAIWEQLAGNITRGYNEVFFDLGAITLVETISDVTLQVRGATYGSVDANFTHIGYEL